MKSSPFTVAIRYLACLCLLLTVAAPVHVRAAVRYVNVNSASPASPYTSWVTAATTIQDAIDVASDGDQILVTNGVYQTGGRVANGALTNRVAVTRPVTVQSVNGPDVTIIRGNQVPGTTNGDAAIRCVYLTNGAMLSGFTLTNGATATNFLGSQFDFSGGGVFCESSSAVVSNCILSGNSAASYGGAAAGPYLGIFLPAGTLDNCVLVGNSASSGGGASSCALKNCALTGNSAPNYWGGGALYCSLDNCTLMGNSAQLGGGARGSRLNNCLLTGNSTRDGPGDSAGGGAETCTLTNCTLTGNAARDYGGGAAYCNLYNCIVYYNFAGFGDPNVQNFGLIDFRAQYCCTTLPPYPGTGNITNAPLFLDTNGWSNLRLQSNSPAINAGRNAYATVSSDLDSNPRIAGGTVDMGAYECQSPQSTISYGWLQQYGLPTDGSADHADPDSDGRDTWQEWRCLTDPTNALSVLRLVSVSSSGPDVLVSWASVPGVSYFLQRSTNLSSAPFSLLATNLPGQPFTNTATFTDPNAAGMPLLFYRVGVGP